MTKKHYGLRSGIMLGIDMKPQYSYYSSRRELREASSFGPGVFLGGILGMVLTVGAFQLTHRAAPAPVDIPNVAACKSAGGFMIKRGELHYMCVKEIRKR